MYHDVKKLKNIFSLTRLICAFIVDSWYYAYMRRSMRAAKRTIAAAGPPPPRGATPARKAP
eukprot:gene12022-6723_t